MVWMRSVVGITEGVAVGGVTITGSVVGTGVGTAVAGAGAPASEVQPDERMHSRITRAGIRVFTRFIAKGLLFVSISDLRQQEYARTSEIWRGKKKPNRFRAGSG
jgi:hypothetical protein